MGTAFSLHIKKVSRLKLLAGHPNFPLFLQAYYERNNGFLTYML